MKKLPGRPSKSELKKFVVRNITLPPDCDKYILNIIAERKLNTKGWYARIIAEIIKDHKNVKQFKEIQIGKLKGQLKILEG